ncbi:hypothetical protein ACN9ML_17055 [Dyadobacter endophyticus]|uniref:Anti-sigma factor n=1 Tax=Dyadobacter endophyticus TaxID=1749036 RepID=A0ABQ1Z1I6_9BACT|nr:hypothetical protein [Dyadobacter endophyticus]GGH46256.1 hypothetical protein GCM10007423_45860 [Dyadobacter endophyticus]
MSKQEFIESGILESHLMGLANEEEQQLVAEMMLSDRKMSEYVNELEVDIKSYFAEGSVPPPDAVREIILLRSIREKKGRSSYDVGETVDAKQFLDVEVNDTHIKVHKFWRPAFIAVFILSKIFLIAGLYFYFKSVAQQEEIEKIKTEMQVNNK